PATTERERISNRRWLPQIKLDNFPFFSPLQEPLLQILRGLSFTQGLHQEAKEIQAFHSLFSPQDCFKSKAVDCCFIESEADRFLFELLFVLCPLFFPTNKK